MGEEGQIDGIAGSLESCALNGRLESRWHCTKFKVGFPIHSTITLAHEVTGPSACASRKSCHS